jgi:hypothetical protein
MIATEANARNLGREYHVPVIGTFNPAVAQCPATEFYDFMHASTLCLGHLDSIAQ